MRCVPMNEWSKPTGSPLTRTHAHAFSRDLKKRKKEQQQTIPIPPTDFVCIAQFVLIFVLSPILFT